MLEIKYTNVHGETMHIVQNEVTKEISLHHEDIHEDEKQYEALIFCLNNYIFNSDEYRVIGTFTDLCTALL